MLSAGAELTFDRILRDIEILQIDKVAALLRKATYRKNGNYQHKTTRSDRGAERGRYIANKLFFLANKSFFGVNKL